MSKTVRIIMVIIIIVNSLTLTSCGGVKKDDIKDIVPNIIQEELQNRNIKDSIEDIDVKKVKKIGGFNSFMISLNSSFQYKLYEANVVFTLSDGNEYTWMVAMILSKINQHIDIQECIVVEKDVYDSDSIVNEFYTSVMD